MINEFKEALRKFINQKCSLEDVGQHLHQLLKKHPQLANQVATQLEQLVSKKQISQEACRDLKKITDTYNVSDQADATTLATSHTGEARTAIGSVDATKISPGYPDTDTTRAARRTTPTSRTSDDATEIIDHDKTEIVSEDQDATVISTEVPDKSSITGGDDFSMDLDDAGGQPPDAAPTIGPDGMPVMTHGDEIIDVGSVLRNRFELLDKLGEGGMGAVFRAVDKIKEEAQDKNPYVAVKVLNENFKKFRESFIALQRESSKQQRLAHPNIATVFDFDRDYTYGTVFMTMEMLEGEPLDKFIRGVPPQGLSYEEARPVIDGMCNGLAYAHHHNLVHSDFKPANTFLNKEGVVKLLDFGIARAAKPKEATEDGEQESTLFDPGTLGALTPAYASAEMLEGETPEPPDDIYALACVTYQLLGGSHPFNKTPANQARENKLSVKPLKKLNTRQMKALAKGLAFDREKRTQTVEEFQDGITPKKPIMAWAIAATIVMLTIIGVLAKGTIEDKLRLQRDQQLIAELSDEKAAGDITFIKQKLDQLQTFERDSQERIKADRGVQNAIVGYFSRLMDNQVDEAKGRYNYPASFDIMRQARTYYPDSGTLDNKQQELDNKKAATLQKQRDLYTRFLKIGPWLPTEGSNNDIPDVIAIIKEVEPDHSLLTDSRLLGSYIKEQRGSIESEPEEEEKSIASSDTNDTPAEDDKFDRAARLLEQATVFFPDNNDLINEADKLAQAKFSHLNNQLLEEIVSPIKASEADKGIRQAFSVSKELEKLRLIKPDDELLKKITDNLTTLFSRRAKAAKNQITLGNLENQFLSLAPSMTAEQQNAIRSAINDGWKKAGGLDPELASQRRRRADEIRQKINDTAASEEFTHEWTLTLKQLVGELQALLGNEHLTVQEAKKDLAIRYLQQTQKMSEDQRLSQSRILLAYAKAFDNKAQGLIETEALVKTALEEREAARLEEERLATITALKQDLLFKAEAEQVDDAIAFLEELKVFLLPEDEFLVTAGPEAIATAYASKALRSKNLADNKRDFPSKQELYRNAVAYIESGKKFAPTLEALDNARKLITDAATVATVRNIFRTANELKADNLTFLLQSIREADPERFSQLQTEYAETIAERIATLEKYDTAAAQAFLAVARQLPLNQNILSRIRITVIAPSRFAQQIGDLIKDSKLSEAGSVLKKALAEEGGHPKIKSLNVTLAAKTEAAKKAYKKYQIALKDKDTEQAKKLIATALKIWRDNTEYQSAFKSINISIIASNAVCQERIAGYGRKRRGRCYDMVSLQDKGPIMVVVPPGAGRDNPFAISKFEISIGDYNHYCKKTNNCNPSNLNPKLPVTGITFAQAQGYAEWLSKISGAKYRIPTDQEWVYAASSGGTQPKGKNYNCTLRLGDKILKGTGLEDVNSGKQNGWGLANYIGNAQEWVTSNNNLKVRGGAFTDAMAKCSIELERTHNGNADNITSFRLIRDII